MALKREAVFLVFMMVSLTALCGVVKCYWTETYTVGESAGWTKSGIVDYNKWASSKTIYVGDILVFQYHSGLDNVIRLSAKSFNTCDTTKPQATYSSGFDILQLDDSGEHFFTSGFPGHCQAGQKVRIFAHRRPYISPIGSPSPSAIAPTPAAQRTASALSTILI